MPKPRKNEKIRCTYFAWTLRQRNGIWYADGRSNTVDAGRHSLDVRSKQEALQRLAELDQMRAEDLGLIPRSARLESPTTPLSLGEGRKLYEQHVARPRVTGGVRKSTQKKYCSVFDKFLPFAAGRGVTTWNGVTSELLCAYVGDLEAKGYAHKTQSNELITLKQTAKWLIKQGHLQETRPIELSVRKAESERAYCYRSEEVRAMIEHCRANKCLHWLANVIIALACTGLRIAELVSLRWADLDFENDRLSLTDETGRPRTEGRKRRELKSGRSRSFPIHPALLDVLQRMLRVDAYVFHGPRGGRLKPDTVRRILIREVIEPLTERFPSPTDEKGFGDARLHSFRYYFCSTCANSGVPERMVMEWLGHVDSEMVRHYYHLHDEEARRRMADLDFLGGAGGCSAGDVCQ